MKTIKPGVVTGEDYVALVDACKAGGYALPAVNVTDTNTVNASLEAAAKTKSDIIIQLSNGGAGYFGGPAISTLDTKVKGAVSAARHIHLMAEDYGIAVVIHTDHANRSLLPWIDGIMVFNEEAKKLSGRPLFSSHMIDLSEEPIAQNIATCADYLKRMAPCDISLEIELGVTGGEEDGVGADLVEGADNAHLYTQPEHVLEAYDALHDIGHFTVAASFGNVHGVYKPGNVKLRPEILLNSQNLVQRERKTADRPLDLVFHGGSGSEKAKIAEALSYGVFKMNIDTDTQFAFAKGVGAYVREHGEAFTHQIHPETGKPLKKFYDPRKWGREAQKSFVARLEEAFQDLQSLGRSVCNR